MKKNLDYIDDLTNEKLMKRFSSQFDLVRYAIQCAKECVNSGKDPVSQEGCHNIATYILAVIASNTETPK